MKDWMTLDRIFFDIMKIFIFHHTNREINRSKNEINSDKEKLFVIVIIYESTDYFHD